MSKTIVDMPKVAQMLDAGWQLRVYKNGLGSYSVETQHPNDSVVERMVKRLREQLEPAINEIMQDDDLTTTDDFTPEQALTRAAYKVHGEILP